MSNCVYKITNLITQKSYIGSTNNFQRRMSEHKVFAHCNANRKGYNLPLYCSFRKYGLNNFHFEIIVDNIDTLLHARQIEEQKIKDENTIIPNGYNIKSSTEGMDENMIEHLIKINGFSCALISPNEEIIEKYDSLRQAGRINNISAECISNVCKGLAYSCSGKIFRYLDNDKIVEIEPKYSIKCTPICAIDPFDITNIYYYNSIKEASEIVGVTPNLISKCIDGDSRYSVVKGYIWRRFINNKIIENNLLIKEISNEQQNKYILYNGERKTLASWCKELNKPYDKVRYQIKYKNKTFNEAIELF